MTIAIVFAVVAIAWNAGMIVHGATTGRLFLPWSNSTYASQTLLFWFGMLGAFAGICVGLFIMWIELS